MGILAIKERWVFRVRLLTEELLYKVMIRGVILRHIVSMFVYIMRDEKREFK